MRTLALPPAVFALLVLAGSACNEEPSEGGGTDPAQDVAEAHDPGSTLDPGTPEPDAAGDVPPDQGPEVAPEPLALVFAENPVKTPELTEVRLDHLTGEDGELSGEFAFVTGCAPDLKTGATVPLDLGGFALDLVMCTPRHTALPGEDGTYRHIVPPENHGAGDDAFAEVMMYHHIQVVHDYVKGVHGITSMDFPLDAVVNLQVYEAVICDGWATLPNAAYLPPGSLAEFPVPLPLDPDAPHILFSGSETKDFAYDADVIYHEYGHAVVGEDRLQGTFLDPMGTNNLPVAVNEAYADYFAATIVGDSVMGDYALGGTEGLVICGIPLSEGGMSAVRDLAEMWTCPESLTGEVHADSQLYSSAMWAVREALGAEKADAIFVTALAQFTQMTDFEIALVAAVVVAGELYGKDAGAVVEAAFSERGLIGCKRRLPLSAVGKRGIPLLFEGGSSKSPFGGKMPGYVQLGATVPDGATELTVHLNVQGGGFLGGGGNFAFEAVWKPGAEPVSLDAEAGTHDGVAATPFEKVASGKYETRLSGCLAPGEWTFAILNQAGAFAIVSASTSHTTGEPPAEPAIPCEE